MIFAATAALVAMAGGVFSGNTATVSSLKYINSPASILALVGSMTVFAMLLFTNVCGDSIYKDYKTGAYQLMYSYPFSKPAYFFGKFFSAFAVCLILILCIGFGIAIGFAIPGINQDMIGPHSFRSYFDVYLYYMIPNTFLFCAIVFAVVTYSRSIIMGFVVMIAIYILSGVVESYLVNQEYFNVAALIDPFGSQADAMYTKYWTIHEHNNSPIPIKAYVIYNRLLWLSIAIAILAWSYFTFSFETVRTSWSPFRKKETVRSIGHQAKQVFSLKLPDVKRSFGLKHKLNSAWLLTKIDLSYILKGGAFIITSIIGLVFVVLTLFVSGEVMGTTTYPLTANMLLFAGSVFRLFILLLTFIYVGLIINRRTDNNIYQLEDVSATKNFSFLLSKLFTISLMQAILLALPMIASIIYQIAHGYYNFEIDLYLFDTYAIRWVSLIPWTLLAIFIFAMIPNFYLGLLACLVISIGVSFFPSIGIEKTVFQYNSGPTPMYSDMTSYTGGLAKFYVYRLYWTLGGFALAMLGLYYWRRGVQTSFKERLSYAKLRSFKSEKLIGFFSLGAFLIVGSLIYYNAYIKEEFVSSKEYEKQLIEFEKKYKKYEAMPQPRIVDVNLTVELYPATQDIETNGYYILKNKTSSIIDTVVVNHYSLLRDVSFDSGATIGLKDTTLNFRTYGLGTPLLPGDSTKMTFTMKNKDNSIFHTHGPVKENATFFNSSQFPTIGYDADGEISSRKTRTDYGLEPKERMAEITDTTAYGNTYLSNCSDWINFEMVIGTEIDQLAMAPGQLQREWEENDRKYYHYKMDQKMLNFYNISSARYEVAKDNWNDVELTILYHEGHDFNIDRMMLGLKDGFDYYTREFGPYQFKQLRILEFPFGGYAQSYANTVPYAENAGFTAMVDDEDEGGIDYAYVITAHELAHQWWGHQVVGANVRGATMLSESLAEYSCLKVLEKRYGVDKMRLFLKRALDTYLMGRIGESSKELPLAFNENQQYIHYYKGSLIFYALSDLIGEDVLNSVLSDYIKEVGFQEPPYTTSLELLDLLKQATPDSLQYFIEDSFENITLYGNRVESASYTDNDDGTYTVDITAHVTKYRTDEKGKQLFVDENGQLDSLVIEGQRKPVKSYPLNDYLDVGIFGITELDGEEKENVIYQKKHKITQIENKFTITVDQEPLEVGIDPFNKLIDRDSNDNRRKPEKVE